jgi:hypothetical protein
MYHIPQYKIIKKIIIIVHSKSIPNIQLAKKKGLFKKRKQWHIQNQHQSN